MTAAIEGLWEGWLVCAICRAPLAKMGSQEYRQALLDHRENSNLYACLYAGRIMHLMPTGTRSFGSGT